MPDLGARHLEQVRLLVGGMVGWLVGWLVGQEAGRWNQRARQTTATRREHTRTQQQRTDRERETMHGGGRGEKLGHSQKPKGLGQGQTKVKVIPDD